MLSFQQYLKENKKSEHQSPYHQKFLDAGYTHKWSGKPGDSRGNSKGYDHRYSHPDDPDQIKKKLDEILPKHQYSVMYQNVQGKSVPEHLYYKKGNSIKVELKNDGGHILSHFFDHDKQHEEE